MSSTARPLSSASRPTSSYGIQTSTYPPALPSSSSFSESRKRKRPYNATSTSTSTSTSTPTTADGLLKAPVVIKPHPSSLTVKPRMLHPLMLLPREQLPLSALDLAQPNGDFPTARLFESKIKILDLEGRLGSNVLLARSETSRMIYALERESNGLYVLCKLGGWVDVEELALCATVVCNERIRPREPKPAPPAFPALITPQMLKENKKKKDAIEEIQSMVRKRSATVTDKGSQSQVPTPTGLSPIPDALVDQAAFPVQGATTTPLDTPLQTPKALPLLNPHQTPGEDSVTQPDAETIFQNIRTHYFEALYHSMGSLAYFAKGPLSRARAAFHLDCDSSLEMNDLIDFLRSLVTSTVLIDKKYRETIPDILAKMKTHIDDSDEGQTKSRKRKAKKPKMGKDGLYPAEDDHVRRWWTANKPASHDEDGKTVASMETRYHISCLRRRETQLQMILILEILALEPLRRATEVTEDSQLPGMESQNTAGEATQETGTKKRNKTNLPVLLDVHADRLCIWQSTTLDDVRSLAESQNPAAGQDTQKSERANSDPLRDFCVDIIIPFFSARLPELCDSINRKLGGPVTQAPQKEKYAKPALPIKTKPGAPIKRSSALKKGNERTLEHVLSKERMRRSVSRGPSGAIALMRSASATTIPGLKREGSEPLIAMIPREDASSLKDRPANVFRRSVSSTITAQEAKAKKAALVEAELKDAISALKKPNRTLAAKELVEAAEKRIVPPKKLKRPGRVSNVQVKATPANNRFKDVLAAESQLDEDVDVIPPSSVVPASSGPARRFSNIFASAKSKGATTSNPFVSYQAQATPTRKPSLPTTFEDPVLEEENADANNLPSSPVMARKAAPSVLQSAAPPRIRLLGNGANNNNNITTKSQNNLTVPSSPGLTGLFETPLQSRSSKDNTNRTMMMMMRGTVDDTPIKAKFLSVKSSAVTRTDSGGENSTTTTTTTITTKTSTGTMGMMDTTTPEKMGLDTILGETPLAAAAGRTTGVFTTTPTPTMDGGVGVGGGGVVPQEKKATPNIYQRLGWDDDFDDLA